MSTATVVRLAEAPVPRQATANPPVSVGWFVTLRYKGYNVSARSCGVRAGLSSKQVRMLGRTVWEIGGSKAYLILAVEGASELGCADGWFVALWPKGHSLRGRSRGLLAA